MAKTDKMLLRKDQLQQRVKLLDDKDAQYVEVEGDKEKLKELTVRVAIRRALANTYSDEQQMTGDDKLKRFMLAQKIWNGEDVELSSEEVTEIKRCVAKAWGVEVIGFIYNLIDPKTES